MVIIKLTVNQKNATLIIKENLMNTWMLIYVISLILIVPTLIYGLIAQRKTIATFESLAEKTTGCNISASELARVLLDNAGAKDVKVVKIDGRLTDCYDPRYKVVKLSSTTFSSFSVAALGVAAHEVGHAIQHHQKNALFRFRSFLIPVMNFISRAYIPLILAGSLLSFAMLIPTIGFGICWASVIFYGMSLILNFATLGVERDASKKALAKMKETSYFTDAEIHYSKQVLDAAIETYIASFTTSLLYFLRFLSMFVLINKD